MSKPVLSPQEARDERRRMMLEDPIFKILPIVALPMVLSTLIDSFYNLADTFFVRHLEQDSMVAAVGVVLPLMNIIQAIGFYHGHGSGNSQRNPMDF